MAQTVKNPPAMWETWVQSLGREDPLEEATATHSSIRACRIPWIEEPGGLQSMRSQRDTTEQLTHTLLLSSFYKTGGRGFRRLLALGEASSQSPGLWSHPAGAGGAVDPQESRGLATQRWEWAVLSELQLQAPTPLGSQQRSRALLECLVGGSCDSCWKNRRPPRGTESHPEVSKCGKHPDLQGEGQGSWVWSLGPWGRGVDAPRGQGERETASFTPRRPVRASQRCPAGPGVEGHLCAVQEEGAWGGNLPSAWASIRPLNWDGRPLPRRVEASEGSCLSAPLSGAQPSTPYLHSTGCGAPSVPGGPHVQLGDPGGARLPSGPL